MSLRINQNVLAIQTHDTLVKTQEGLGKSLEKLSSGLRINRAADDAAGLAISEKLRRQIKGLSRAILNGQDGISMIQTAEGALDESHSILQRMRELAIEAGNDTLTSNDRLEIQKEVITLRDDLNRIARNTEFNTKKLLDGSQTALVSSSSMGGRGVVTGLANAQGEYHVQVTETTAGTAQELRSNIMTIKGTSDAASTATKLEDIANFYDSNGVFMLDSAQTIYVHANSKNTEIQVTKDLSLDQLATLLQNAITDKLGVAQSVVNVNLGFSEAPGTLQVISGRTGREGEITISADQGIVNALGFATLVQAVDSVHSVRVSNLDGSNAMTAQTSTGRTSGLLPGIDIAFDSVTSGAAIGSQATLGVGSVTDISIGISDYLGNSIDVSIGNGGTNSFSLEQIASVINSYTTNNSVRVLASASGGKLQLNSLDTGSGALVSVSNTSTGARSVGMTNGRYTGSSGTTAQAVGYDTADLDYSTNNATFSLTDSHGTGQQVVLNIAYGTVDGVVSDINTTLAGGGVMVRAYNSAGVVLFRSLESGQTSNFNVVDQGNMANKLHVYATTTSNGTGGTAANPTFTPDGQNLIFGFNTYYSLGVSNVSLLITDHLGHTTSIVGIGVDSIIGNVFTNANDVVSIINAEIAATPAADQVRATATLTSDHRLRIGSNFSGENTFVGVTDVSGSTDFGTLTNFGVNSKTYEGTGASDFRLHVVNNRPQFQIGADQGQTMEVALLDMTAAALGVENLVMTSTKDANTALGKINIAIDKVSSERAKLGAYQNRLDHAISNLRNIHTNLTSAESRLRDADMAQEMIGFTRNQIISQSGTAMLAQANLVPQGVLQLLR